MLIRPAVPADAAELAALHLRVWDEAYTGLIASDLLAARAAEPATQRTERWRKRLLSTPTWLAVGDAVIVGFVQAGHGRDPDRAGLELMALYTIADVHGTGLGQLLLDTAIGEVSAYLWVFDGNARATRFYERNGFAFDGTTRQDKYGAESRMAR